MFQGLEHGLFFFLAGGCFSTDHMPYEGNKEVTVMENNGEDLLGGRRVMMRKRDIS